MISPGFDRLSGNAEGLRLFKKSEEERSVVCDGKKYRPQDVVLVRKMLIFIGFLVDRMPKNRYNPLCVLTR